MKVKIKQSHSVAREAGRWEERRAGEIVEIEPGEFAPNLHEEIEEKKASRKVKSNE